MVLLVLDHLLRQKHKDFWIDFPHLTGRTWPGTPGSDVVTSLIPRSPHVECPSVLDSKSASDAIFGS